MTTPSIITTTLSRVKYGLYDTFVDKSKILSAGDKKKVLNAILKMDVERKKMTLLLISEYAFRNGWDGKGLPLGAEQQGNDVHIPRDLPDEVFTVLSNFVDTSNRMNT